ncbi:reverse transcriptase domain, reverse transcriptase zinc-binding domain protein, partial [Tanacetum coccineum]
DPLSPFLFILAAEGLNLMIKKAVEKGIFKGIKVGSERVVVSHLQYADDTIFFDEWDKGNAKNLMCNLKCFERVSGLKVNLTKSRLYGVGVNSDEVSNMASWMQCSVGEFPFTYLGLPIGIGWGLNIGSLRAKNWALVGKWWWRFKREGDALWVRLIKSIYGESGSLEFDGVGSRVGRSGLWCDIVKVGDIRLRERFPRLFQLDRRKETRVVDRGRWCEGVWRWEWDWVREPRGRACGDVGELTGILQNVILTLNCKDSWRWNLTQDEDGNFKVKDLAFMVDDVCLSVGNTTQVNVFVWRVLHGRILVCVKLDKIGIDLDSLLCPCCDDSVESCDHSLVTCNVAKSWECGCSFLLKSFVAIGNMDNRLRALTGFRGDRRKLPSTGRNGSSIPQVA